MPIYEYKCELCGTSFDKYFPTISSAEGFIVGHPCEKCSAIAERVMSRPPKVFWKDHERPYYSNPSNPEKV